MHEAYYDGWRKELNGAIRTFASSAPGADEATRQTLVSTMLREIGEALRIDCAALLPLSNNGHPPRHYHWFRRFVPANGSLFDVPALQTLVSHMKLDRDPVMLTTEPDPRADDATSDALSF